MDIPQTLIAALIVSLVCGSSWLWLRAFDRRLQGLPLLPAVSGEARPWGLIDLVICAVLICCATLIAQSVYAMAVIRPRFPDSIADGHVRVSELPGVVQLDIMLWGQVGLFIGLVLSLAALVFRTRASAASLGWPSAPRGSDFLLGLAAFLMLLAPVYVVQLSLHWLLPESFFSKPHPIMRILSEQPDRALLGRVFLIAVVLAPVIEEVVFRGLLQGWLRNVDAAARGASWWLPTADGRLVHGFWGLFRSPVAASQNELPGDGQAELVAVKPIRPDEVAVGVTAPESGRGGRTSWPIVASSALFAAAHVGNAMDPIPLFLLAYGLGYVYDRTGRILPCVVIHLLNNLLSFTLLSYAISRPHAP